MEIITTMQMVVVLIMVVMIKRMKKLLTIQKKELNVQNNNTSHEGGAYCIQQPMVVSKHNQWNPEPRIISISSILTVLTRPTIQGFQFMFRAAIWYCSENPFFIPEGHADSVDLIIFLIVVTIINSQSLNPVFAIFLLKELKLNYYDK